jgi:hypothetical protein
MSRSSLSMRSLPSGTDVPFRGNADRPPSLDSELGVLPRPPHEPMPAPIGGLSLRFPSLGASALAPGLIQSSLLFLLRWVGLMAARRGWRGSLVPCLSTPVLRDLPPAHGAGGASGGVEEPGRRKSSMTRDKR